MLADVCYTPGQNGITFACVFAFLADFYDVAFYFLQKCAICR